MAYEMPLVVKEVYLPKPKEALTIEEYKEKYGIDLIKEFNIQITNDENIRVEAPRNTKVFVVNDYNVSVGYVQCIIMGSNEDYPIFTVFTTGYYSGINPDNPDEVLLLIYPKYGTELTIENLLIE